MAIDICDRVIRIQRGMEQKFHVTNEISCEHSFMYPAFLQAQRALREIIQHTEAFYQDGRAYSDNENRLFEYGGNIILFAAPRGGGKTRTMLSFSHILEAPNESVVCCSLNNICSTCKYPPQWLDDSVFYVTAPIAPTVLENGQNILYVVLSRLYRYAETLLLEKRPSGRVTEYQQNELYMAFNRCLAGINGLKKNSSSPEDFTILQEISDGLLLRDHFYSLTKKLLEIAAPHKTDATRYLVLQFDDADSKIDNAFAVFEDIRKYLLIPNLVILMSADLDSLHKVITQDHLKQFSEVIQRVDIGYSENLAHVARKYIDKLIPPSHLINLPNFGKLSIAEIRQLKLLYVDEKGEPVLTLDEHKAGEQHSNLDDFVLNLVYRKTHIMFVRPTTYLHNLIPWTPRGLNQLLNLLVEMADIPDVLEFSPASKYIEEIAKQCKIAQRNLSLFTDYFTNDWIKVKIRNFNDQLFLARFINSRPAERIKEAIVYLQDRFKDRNEDAIKAPDGVHFKYDLYFLNKLTSKLMDDLCKQDEYLLLFAIHTLLTLSSHRLIWERKYERVQQFVETRSKVENCSEKEEREAGREAIDKAPIVFSYASESEMVASIIQKPQVSNEEYPYLYTFAKHQYQEFIGQITTPQVRDALKGVKERFSDSALVEIALNQNEEKFDIDEDCKRAKNGLLDYLKEGNRSIDDVVVWLDAQPPKTQAVKDALATIKANIRNMPQLLNNALSFSRTEYDQDATSKEQIDRFAEALNTNQIKDAEEARRWLDSALNTYYSNTNPMKRMAEIFCSSTYMDVYELNLMNIFLLLVRLDDGLIDIFALVDDMDPDNRQKELYLLQEFGLQVTTNWDVLKRIYRQTKELTLSENGTQMDASVPFDSVLKALFDNLKLLIPSLFNPNEIFGMDIMVKLRKLLAKIYDAKPQRTAGQWHHPDEGEKGLLITVRIDEAQLNQVMKSLQKESHSISAPSNHLPPDQNGGEVSVADS